MSKSTIVFVGFSKPSYIREARILFPQDQFDLVCIYQRKPSLYHEEKYFPLFDAIYFATDVPPDLKTRIHAITCTQERDILLYINFQLECGIIDAETHYLWTQLVDKHTFKKTVAETLPDLVPRVTDFTFDDSQILLYPSVIKPTNYTGSSFVHILKSAADLEVFKAKFQTAMDPQKTVPKLIVEEFVSGPQYSLNVYVNATGAITFCPLIRVIPAFELHKNDTYSAIQYNTNLKNEDMDSLRQAIESIVRIFRINNTSAHFDCMYSATGWKICEASLRIGGLRQEIFKASYGFSHIQNDLDNRVGKSVNLGQYLRTFAIIQKTTERFGFLNTTTCIPPTHPEVAFSIVKQYEQKPKVGPVGLGGMTAFRAYLSHPDEKIAVEAAHEVFQRVDFTMNEAS